jgi:nucleoside permease NupC
MLGIFQPVLGALVILGIGYAFSTNRRAINWTTVAWGLGLQIVFAFIVLKTSIGQVVFWALPASARRSCSDRLEMPASGAGR